MPFQDAYKDISDLHYIETRLATLPPIFDAQLELVGQLDSLNERFFHRSQVSEETCSKMKETVGNLRRRLEAYNANVAFVLGKIRSTTQLVSFQFIGQACHSSSVRCRILSTSRASILQKSCQKGC